MADFCDSVMAKNVMEIKMVQSFVRYDSPQYWRKLNSLMTFKKAHLILMIGTCGEKHFWAFSLYPKMP